MDRAKFLAGLKGTAAKLSPFTIAGFDEPIFIKPVTMAEVKAELSKADEPADVKARLKKDPLYIERSIARVVRDEKGALLFDEKDDAQMAELRAVLDETGPEVSRQIQSFRESLQKPDKSEADPQGN